jgi:hypothetical protein
LLFAFAFAFAFAFLVVIPEGDLLPSLPSFVSHNKTGAPSIAHYAMDGM